MSPRSPVALALRDVKGPRPVLSRDAEASLTDRQHEILDELLVVFAEGFQHLTMADLAAQVNCSLRTLYGFSASREELVSIVVDRNLWQIGRSAMEAIDPAMSPLEAIRSYLRAATMAVADTTEALANDCAASPATRLLSADHSQYLIDITRALLDMAVADGDIAAIDSAAVARVMAGLGADFASPEVLPTLASTPKQAADAVVDVVLRGLAAHGDA